VTYVDSVVLNLTEWSCRKFQLLTGRTNVWLALQLTNLSIIVYFVWAGAYFLAGDPGSRVFIGIFCTGVLYLLTQTVFKVPIEAYENSAYRRVASGFRNPRRVRDAVLRISFLTLSLLLSYPVLLVYFNLRIRIVLLTYSLIVLTTVVLYLLACDPLPPCAGKVREWLSLLGLQVYSRQTIGHDRRHMPRAAALLTALALYAAVWGAGTRSADARGTRSADDGGGAQPATATARWYKGNTHTHTLNSDGDSTPGDVVRWYREHGYRFLVLTDHNFLTSVDGLNALYAADEKFLVIRGEGVSDRLQDKPIHLNGLDVTARVEPQHGGTVADVIQRNVDAIRGTGGVPHVNHPNFEWAISGDDLMRLERVRLFEIYNGHPRVNNAGGGGVPGMEEVWDRLLTSGRVMYGVADDDAHVFKQPGNPDVSGPGRGWVVVRAERLAPGPIVGALERGDFYASTGVELSDYQVTAKGISIAIKEQPFSKYRIQFIGAKGRLLEEATSSPATYAFTGQERYVRARVLESNGRVAWMQPVIR
jgi:hypothetical protein